MDHIKANLFVVGAMKAGTTSFIEVLSRHEQVYVPPLKEPHYFIDQLPKSLYEPSRFFSLESYLSDKFPEPLHIAKIETEKQYNQLFSISKGQAYKVDGSTAYLSAQESAQMIYNYNPNAKIIILLRDPLRRAFSHYKMNLGKGREKRPFESVLLDEIELYNKGQLPWYSYIGMSFYNIAISRFTTLFDQVLVIKFEDFTSNTDVFMKKVENFLEIKPFSERTITRKNESKTLKFQKMFYFLKQLGLKDYFAKIFSSKFRQWLFGKMSKKGQTNLMLSSETLANLEVIFMKESR